MTQFDKGMSDAPSQLYRAFWRWHFYAGIFVAPFLMLLALTGGLYLFNDEIDDLLYGHLSTVPVRASATGPQAWISAAEAATGGQALQIIPPTTATQAAKLVLKVGDAKQAAFVDVHDGRVVGTMPAGGVMDVVKQIHSLEIAGPMGPYVVEIVAGWAIVLVATGLVLWWPRGRKGGVVTVRGGPERRVFWRDIHAVTGLFVGGFIVFLAATGMPWSAFWGQQARAAISDMGWGRPAAPASTSTWDHDPSAHGEEASGAPWTLQHAEMSHSAVGGGADTVVAAIQRSNLPRPYTVSIPQTPGKAWSASHTPDKVEDGRTLYLDGHGTVLADIGYASYGPGAKAVEWGISVHQGQQFGRLNQILMLAACVAIWMLAVSALVMWWKRRPKGRLAAPPRPVDRRAYVPLAAVVGTIAILYPLVGASLLTALVVDLVVQRLRAGTSQQSGA